ncbi:T9SS type A sorting domain-containing protein [Chryseobacterium sp. c4a]|uniref:T9SS type A sorting domain-containing protein n=1 Tax=Chryseobacterium sp. c4a TaxID=1573582 RepID=UPI00135A761A|nr:T9SS type A sorting domain-containing protein [Chryseobacterium sp. c4a]
MKNSPSLRRTIRKILLITLPFLAILPLKGQDKTYVSSQTNQISGLCLICGVQNPENAVGNNEDNYSAFRIGLDVNATVNQALIFPAPVSQYYAKIVIGIGAGMNNLSTELLKGVTIETFLGNLSNNDKMGITGDILKIGSNPKRGTVEFTSQKPFDRIKISLKNNGTLNLDDRLRIYYTYHIPSDYTTCGIPPFYPSFYTPFNGNIENIMGGGTPTVSPSSAIAYRSDMVCGNALYSSTEELTLTHYSDIPEYYSTIAFWGRINDEPSSSIIAGPNFSKFHLLKGQIIIKTAPYNSTATYIIPSNSINQLNHYVMTTELIEDSKKIITCLYKNGHKISPCSSDSYLTPTPPFHHKRGFWITGAQIDEYLEYPHKALNENEVLDLYCSYGKSPDCQSVSGSVPITRARTTPQNKQLIISPNPTTGQITLGGNILLLDADISVSNTSGKEVYRTKFPSKTFDLPASLPGGVYILTLQTKDHKVYSRRVILTR